MSVLYFFAIFVTFFGGFVRNRSSIPILRGISIAILTIAIILTVIALIGYSRQRNNTPVE